MTRISLLDISFASISFLTFITDIVSDIILAAQYFLDGHLIWAVSTILLVFLPGVIVLIFSLQWYITDGKNVTKIILSSHFLFWGMLQRYVGFIKASWKARGTASEDDIQSVFIQQSDICLLRIFEAFMESAPQLVLQLYIMMNYDFYSIWTTVTATSSVISLGWGVAAYSKAQRSTRTDKKQISFLGLLFQTFWRICMITARVYTLALAASVLRFYLFAAMVGHFTIMLIWILKQETGFSKTTWEEKLFSGVMAVVYCYCFFNLKETPSRKRVTAFYAIIISENVALLSIYYFFSPHLVAFKLISLSFVSAASTAGLVLMLLYYKFFHPVGPLPCSNKRGVVDSMAANPRAAEEGSGGSDSTQQDAPSKYRNLKQYWNFSTESTPSPNNIEEDSSSTRTSAKNTLNNQRKRDTVCSVQDLLANFSNVSEFVEDDQSETTDNHKLSQYRDKEGSELEYSQEQCDDASVCGKSKHQSHFNSPNPSFELSPNKIGLPLFENESLASSKNASTKDTPLEASVINPADMKEFDNTTSHQRSQIDNDLHDVPLESAVSLEAMHDTPYPNVELAEVDHLQIIEAESPPEETSCPTYENIYDTLSESSPSPERNSLPLPLPPKQKADNTPLDETRTTHSSLHDYENMAAVNINRAMFGVRHWKTYFDIEDRIHDYSTIKERPKCLDFTVVSSSHSDYSVMKDNPLLSQMGLVEQADSVMSMSLPDLSNLVECGQNAPDLNSEEDKYYVLNNNFPVRQSIRKSSSVDDLSNYEAIWVQEIGEEEPEQLHQEHQPGESSKGVNQSSLVTTIEDVRAKESLCNLYYSTLSDISLRYYCERMLKNGTLGPTNVKSIPKSKPDIQAKVPEGTAAAPATPKKVSQDLAQETPKPNRCRRKFSILLSKFEGQNWTPLKSPLGRRFPMKQISLQNRTSKALQAGIKVFHRPRIHVITPKKDEKEMQKLNTIRIRNPYIPKQLTGLDLQPFDIEVDNKVPNSPKLVLTPKDRQCNEDVAMHPTSTQLHIKDDDHNSHSQLFSTQGDTGPIGPKHSTPETEKHLTQLSMLSGLSSVVLSPEDSIRGSVGVGAAGVYCGNLRRMTSQLSDVSGFSQRIPLSENPMLYMRTKSARGLNNLNVLSSIKEAENTPESSRATREDIKNHISYMEFPNLAAGCRNALILNPDDSKGNNISVNAISPGHLSPGYDSNTSTLSPTSKIFTRRI